MKVPGLAITIERGCCRLLAGTVLALVIGACGQEPGPIPSQEADPAAASPSRATATGSERLQRLVDLDRPPDVVLVTVDTLRADRLGCYGSTTVQTPAFDRLAAEGVRFANVSTTVPFTLPAHSSIMTGTYPPFHGIRENVGYYLSEQNRTLAEMLQEGGWETAGFVSAFVLDRRWGIARGFDHYHDDFDLSTIAGSSLGSVQRDGRETVDAAVAWLRARRDDRPFFLWVHLFDPHDPYTPPEPYASRYPGRPYDGEVAYADSLVGELVAELERRGSLDRTVLVATADHGEGLGDHGEAFHGFFVYDSTVHVPLIVRLPGASGAGQVVDAAVSHVDLAPTLLELAALTVPERVQGRSLVPELAGEPDESRAVYAESLYPLHHYGWAPLHALRTTDLKLIDSPSPELYDLSRDPSERNDLAAARERETAALRQQLEAMIAHLEQGAVAADDEPDLDEQTLAQLRALGYVAGRGSADEDDEDRVREDPKQKIHLHQLIMRAQSRIGAHDEAQAALLLERALQEDPGLIDAHQMLGNIALEGGRPDEALVHFGNALELDDRHQPSLFGRAASYKELHRYDEAVLGFERLLDVAGQDSKATIAIADIEMERGNRERARAVLERAAAADGAPAVVHNRHGEVLALSGRFSPAVDALRQAIATNPRLAQPYFNLAVVLEETGDLAAAVENYRNTIERAPRHYQAQFNLGSVYGRLGQPELQESFYREAITSNPEFGLGYFLLGKLIMDRGGDLAEAETLTRQGLEHQAAQPLGWFVLADVLNRQGRAAEAEAAAARGRELETAG